MFLGAYDTQENGVTPLLIGYVCSTATRSPILTHDSMSTHEADGPYIAIHSVCVAETHLRKGIASALLREYLARLERDPAVQGARLIAHEELVPLYQKVGFELVGPSEVQHGARPWFELRRDFPRQAGAEADKVASTSDKEGDVRSPGRLLGWFEGGIDQVVDSATGTNRVNLYCPRAECRCLLLRAGAGKYVQGTSKDLEVRRRRFLHALGRSTRELTFITGAAQLPDLPRPISAPAPPTPSSKRGYWSVSSPLAFENIGFSRNALPPSSSSSSAAPGPVSSQGQQAGANIKYLTCADCDHGPLGWHDTEGRDLGMEVQAENEARTGGEGMASEAPVRKGREFLLAVERVRYKA